MTLPVCLEKICPHSYCMGKCHCKLSGKPIEAHHVNADWPEGCPETGSPATPARPSPAVSPHWGPAMWAELWARPLTFKGDEFAEHVWLYSFRDRIPECTCQCRTHWQGMNETMPIDLSSPLAYARSIGVRMNAICVRLGRREWTFAEQAERWNLQPLIDGSAEGSKPD